MKITCKCASFDPDNWAFNCTLTGEKCTAGEYFPDLDKCTHKSSSVFIYDTIKEKFDALFPNYSKEIIFWSPCEQKGSALAINIVIKDYRSFIFEYEDDDHFKFYTVVEK